jgi:hypothetical protein
MRKNRSSKGAKEHWLRLIEISFLSDKMKAAYAGLLKDRTQTVGM